MSSISKLIARQESSRRSKGLDGPIETMMETLSPIQRTFIEDKARFKLARCGRRAGKSYADSVYILAVALSGPNIPVLYVGLTRDSAKGAVWQTLIDLLESLDIGYEALGSGPVIKLFNGSYIQLFGADATNARNRLRGRKYKLIVVDEMGFFTEADGLIKSMVPMLADYAGTLVMTSSPGVRLSGLFYEADQGRDKKNWARYSWTLADNPHFQKPASSEAYATAGEEELAVICEKLFAGNKNHPTYRREFLGEWVQDNTSLVYPVSKKNLLDELPHRPGAQFAIGIDLGSASDNAIVIVRFNHGSKYVEIVESFKKNDLLIDELAEILADRIKTYNPVQVVADTGGYGAGIVKELVRRYHLPVKAADKQDKAFYQRIIANDLISGYIKVPFNLSIVKEWEKIVKGEDGNEIKGPANHASDAFLYIYRKIYSMFTESYLKEVPEEQRIIDQIEQSLKDSMEQDIDLF